MKQAKNTWFQKKAWEVEREIMNGTAERGVWQGRREIQSGRAGLQPVRPKAIRNHDGQLCVDGEESLQCWRNHFEAVLNVRSTFVESAIQVAHQYTLRDDMSEPPLDLKGTRRVAEMEYYQRC